MKSINLGAYCVCLSRLQFEGRPAVQGASGHRVTVEAKLHHLPSHD